MRCADQVLTFGALRDLTAGYAARVAEAGVAPGDRVLLIGPSSPEFVAAYYGLHAAGAVLITMNVMATAPEIDHVLDDSGAALVVAWGPSVTAARAGAQARNIPIWALEAVGDGPAGQPVSAPVDRADDDTALIIYTSGTTGRPKGAELTVGGIAALVEAARHELDFDPDTDRTGTPLPLFHVFGQLMVMHLVISFGAPLSLLHPFDPAKLVRAAIRLPDPRGVRAQRNLWVGDLRPLDREPKIGSVGRAIQGLRLQIRDPGGQPLPAGEIGEVWISGPIVMKGYWNQPAATAEAIRDGWLRTGDLGTLDEDGDLRIVGRLKELVIRSGYNVYPSEVEEVLYQHPDIVEAAVVGVADPTYGEAVAAAIVLREGSQLAAEGLRELAKQRLSACKVPHLIQIVAALPKGPSGKILKRTIDREQFR